MTGASATEARRRLAAEAYRPLWDVARTRLERTGLVITNRSVKVQAAGDARAAIAGLVGQTPAGTEPLRVRLDRLDDSLRTGAASIGLVELLEQIDGPLIDRRAARARHAEAVTSSWRSLAEHPTVAIHPRMTEWLEGLRSSGSARRLAGSADAVAPLVRAALDVLARLPVGGTPLAVFAADATGDAHALDRSTVLGSLVTGGLRFVEPAGNEQSVDGEAASATTSWRDAWARVGVVCDEVSVSVLVLNLELDGCDGPVAAAIAEHRRAGLPVRLTLQQLRSETLRISADHVVRSCENPSVVAQAAAALGNGSGALVCTDGQPNGAVDELLRQARARGARLSHHGDFDWGGVRIANALIARHRADPWRFSASDYLAAVEVGRVPLVAPPAGLTAAWDSELVPTMREAGRRVFEEQVVPVLLSDLRAT